MRFSARPRRSARTLSAFEALEPRQLLAAVSWDGQAGDNLWETAANWSNNVIPGAADDVTIDVPGAPTIIYNAGTRTIKSLVSSEAIRLTGGWLTVLTQATNTSATILDGGRLVGGTWNVAANGIGIGVNDGSFIDVNVVGDIYVDLSGAIANISDSTRFTALRLQAGGAGATLSGTYQLFDPIICEGFSTGSRVLTTTRLTIDTAASITVTADCGGDLSIQATAGENTSIVNHGTIRNDSPTSTVGLYSTTTTNSGTVESAGHLNIWGVSSFANTGSLVCTAGSELEITGTWSNSGQISVTDTDVEFNGVYSTPDILPTHFTRTGGTVSLRGTLNNAGQTLLLNAATGSWRLDGCEIKGGFLDTADGERLEIRSGLLENVIVNDVLRLDIVNTSIRLRGNTRFESLHLAADGTYARISGSSYVLRDPVFGEGPGEGIRAIELDSSSVGLTIGPSGSVRFVAGCLGDMRITGGVVTNNGILATDAPGEFGIFPVMFQNNGTITATSGRVVIGGSSTQWSGSGALNVVPGTEFFLNGSWTNTGPVNVVGGLLHLDGSFRTADLATFTRTPNSAGIVRIVGILNNTGSTLSLNAATGSWQLSGGTISGGSLDFADGEGLIYTSSDGKLRDVQVLDEIVLGTASSRVTVGGTTRFPAARLVAPSTRLSIEPGYVLNDVISSQGTAAGTHTIAATATGTFTIAPGAAITQTTGSLADLTITDSSFTLAIVNNGLMEFAAPGRMASINVNSLTNNGTLRAAGSIVQVIVDSTTTGWSNTATIETTNATLSLAGRGVNAGVITTSGGVLTFSSTWSTTGSIHATNTDVTFGGTMTTAGLNLANFHRIGGTVRLTGNLGNLTGPLTLNAATGSWFFSGGVLTSGILNFTDGASLIPTSGGGRISNVQINGELILDSENARVTLGGSTRFTAVRLRAAGATARFFPNYVLRDLIIAEGAVPGDRFITMSASGSASIGPTGSVQLAPGSAGALKFTNDAGNMTLTNDGTISAESPGAALTLAPLSLTNNGAIHAGASAVVIGATTNVTNYATASNTLTGGTWSVANSAAFTWDTAVIRVLGPATAIQLSGAAATFGALGQLAQNAGQLTLSNGQALSLTPFTGTFFNTGALAIDHTSRLDITGAFAQSGALSLAVASTAAYGRLTATDGAALDGSLTITYSGYTMARGDSFDLITASSVTGAFAAATVGAAQGYDRPFLRYEPTQVRLEIIAAADWDGDGFVTGLDYDLFVSLFEQGENADFDGDGFITGLDFDLFVYAFEHG